MYDQSLPSTNPAFPPTAFLKCTKWQLEETLYPTQCPYHYFCNSSYPGNYPVTIDVIVMVFIAASYIATVILTMVEIVREEQVSRLSRVRESRKYIVPSGPVSLPVILVIMAKGHRINTAFPLSSHGPAILQLILISALSFKNEAESDIKYVFFETSTISGILHAALYLDAIILPYYTGLDALVSSTFSGECSTCICRKDTLVVGGRLILYRGWSLTTASVVGTLIFRIFCKLTVENKGMTVIIKSVIESLSWILITVECAYLALISPPDRTWVKAATSGGIFLLICLNILKRLCNWLTNSYSSNHDAKMRW